MTTDLFDTLPEHPYLLHPRTGAPLRAVGVLPSGKVVWPVLGAAESDADLLDRLDPDDDDAAAGKAGADPDDDDDPDAADAEYVPPTKEAFAEIQRQLARANANNKRLKAEKRGTAKPDPDAASNAKDEGRAEAEATYKPLVVNAEAKSLLSSMGMKPGVKVGPILNMLKMSDIDVDEEGEVDGLQEQLDRIKADLPDLFENPRRKVVSRTRGDAAANADAADSGGDPLVKAFRNLQG